MPNFSITTLKGLEQLLLKELQHCMPRENLFPIAQTGAICGSSLSLLPLWRAKTSLLSTSFRHRLHGPVLCNTLADFRARMRSEVDWAEVAFADFRVHTKSSKLFHDGALLEILRQEAGKVAKASSPKLRGDLLFAEIVNDNLEISLQSWTCDERKSVAIHATLLKTGLIEISDHPVTTAPKFPHFQRLTDNIKTDSWTFPSSRSSKEGREEFFFQTASVKKDVAIGLLDNRNLEKPLIDKISKTSSEVWIISKANSGFPTRSSLVWRPDLRWTDHKGSWELLKLIRT